MTRRVLVLLGVAVGVIIWATFTAWGGNPVDAYAYWWAAHRPDVYARDLPCCDFLYTPATYQLAYPLLSIESFPLFAAILRAAETAAVVIFAGPAAVIAFWLPPVATEINAANINLLLMGAVLAGFRYPVAWTFVLLTKPTAGVGLLWFGLRGEWRKAAVPVLVTGAICVVSFVAAPDLWRDWLAKMATTSADPGWPFPFPIWMRLPFALGLILWGARTDRRWPVVLATILAMPRLYFQSPAMLLALLPAFARDKMSRPPAASSPLQADALPAGQVVPVATAG